MSKFFLGKLFSKGKVSPTIKSVNPNVGKPSKSALNKQIQKTKASGAKLKQTLFESKNKAFKGDDFTFSETKKGKGKQSRVRKMGGGMMGRRMGYSEGSSKGKIPTTPKEKSLAKLAPPRNRITFGDVVAGRTKGKRMQAKHGTEDPLRDRMKQPLKSIKNTQDPQFTKKPKPTGTRSGGTRPRTGTKFDPNNPIIIKKKEFKKQSREDAK